MPETLKGIDFVLDLRDKKLTQILIQPQYQPLSVAEQVTILFAGNEGYVDDVENKHIQSFKFQWFEYFKQNCPKLEQKLNEGDKLEDTDKEELKKHLTKFKETIFHV